LKGNVTVGQETGKILTNPKREPRCRDLVEKKDHLTLKRGD